MDKSSDKAARRSAALRDNLKKRKERARGVAAEQPAHEIAATKPGDAVK